MEVSSPRESIFSSALRIFCRTVSFFIAFFIFAFLYSFYFSSSPLLEQKTTLSLLPDAEGKQEMLPISTPVILQIDIHGVIGDPQKIDSTLMSNILIDSQTGLLANGRVKGILLHFNTPGGTVVDSDNIYRMLNDYKARHNIPVYGYVDGLCASGGMYIASSTDKIFSSPSGIIGSVGVVIGPFFNFYDLMGKIGMQAKTITSGLDKDMLNPTRPWKEGEGSSIQAVTDFLYQRFVDVVVKGRPQMDKSKLVGQYGAQVFDCVSAENLGYIDVAMSSRDAALKELLTAAKIESETPYQVVSLTPKSPWISELFSSKSPLFTGKIEHALDSFYTRIQTQPCYLYHYE